LEFNSKLASAGAMTWIDNTSLASATETEPPAVIQPANTTDRSANDWPDFLNSLFVSGVPMETIQAWVKQANPTSEKSLRDDFTDFVLKAIAVNPTAISVAAI